MSQEIAPDISPDISQWLAEIQSLQRKVAELQQERSRAYASADNLRKLYESEAVQRQRDAAAAQQKIEELQNRLAEFQSSENGEAGKLGAEITSIQSNRSVEQLQAQLVAAKRQSEQLKTRLQEEQAEHVKTRESLTAALGDAVDLLAKERSPTPDNLQSATGNP